MPNINFGGSVVKRESKGIDEVEKQLRSEGWNRTSTILGGRVRYFSSSGINTTAIGGPLGTTIIPSGPIRGPILGDTELFSSSSVIGAGKNNNSEGENPKRMREANSNNTTL